MPAPYRLPAEGPLDPGGGGRGTSFSPPGIPSGGRGGFFDGGYDGFAGYSPYGNARRRRRVGAGGGQPQWNMGGQMGGNSLSYTRDPRYNGESGFGGEASTGTPPAAGGSGDYWDALMARFSGSDLGYTHAGGTDAEALADMIIGGQGRGAFGPEGDPRVNAAFEADASRRGLAQEQSAVLGASLDGNDSWGGGLARMMARANSQRSKSDFYNQNRLNNAQNYSDLIRQLLGRKLGQFDTEKNRGWALQDRESSKGGGFPWELGGQVLGAGVGAFFGAPAQGAAIGGAAGGAVGKSQNKGHEPGSTSPSYMNPGWWGGS